MGPAYRARSKDLASDRCVNLYLESVEGQAGSVPRALLGCPGLVLALTLPTSPLRALITVGSGFYAIAGNTAYSISSGLVATALGTIGTSVGPATILFNATFTTQPNHIGFFDPTGIWVWIPAFNTFQPVTPPFSGTLGPPTYLDGFATLVQAGTFNIWQSGANDFTNWNGLNFTTEDGNAEPAVAVVALHDQFLVFKQNSYCPFVNAGLNGFVFERLEGVYPAVGCVSAQTVVRFADVICWLGQTDNGAPKIYLTASYQPDPVSNYAIENDIASYSTVADAYAFGYTQEGHDFYVISFPTAGHTWTLDLKETRLLKTPVWHERALFNPNTGFTLYPGTCAAQLGGQVYMGDAFSGNIYRLDLTNFQDNGQMRKWLRSWRAIAGATKYETEKCNYLDVQMETGDRVPNGTNPQLVLRQSFDGARNWSAERYQPAGKPGEYMKDVRFTRLGATRRGLNSDRVFELSSTEVFFPALLGAEIA